MAKKRPDKRPARVRYTTEARWITNKTKQLNKHLASNPKDAPAKKKLSSLTTINKGKRIRPHSSIRHASTKRPIKSGVPTFTFLRMTNNE